MADDELLAYFVSRNEPPIENFYEGTPNFFLSNFYPRNLTYRGLVYPSSEHLYQAMKATTVTDREYVRTAISAGVAKKRGREITLVTNWDNEKAQAMWLCLHIKFTQHFDLGLMLNATGNAHLKEGNHWHDNVFGECTCGNASGTRPRCDLTLAGAGDNLLGRQLMALRAALRTSATV